MVKTVMQHIIAGIGLVCESDDYCGSINNNNNINSNSNKYGKL
jgi:hypothetical protein